MILSYYMLIELLNIFSACEFGVLKHYLTEMLHDWCMYIDVWQCLGGEAYTCTIDIALILISQIAKFMGPTWGPPGSCQPPMGPMLAQWTLLSGLKLCENKGCQSPSQLFRYTGVAIFTDGKWIQWMAATLVRFDIWMYKYGLILLELDWWHGLETLFPLVD